MFKGLINKLAEKSVEAVGNGIKVVGKVVETAPSQMELYVSSTKLCYKLGQLEGLEKSIQNKSIVSEMETRIALLEIALEKGRNKSVTIK
jgi:hypothetical protein